MSTQTILNNLKGLAEDSAELLRAEAMLARTETEETIGEMMGGVAALAAGAIVGLVALAMFAEAAVAWLANYVPPAIAALVVGVALAAVGAILFAIGRNRMKVSSLAPRRTIRSIRTTAARVKEAA